jgi:hypothetical protein
MAWRLLAEAPCAGGPHNRMPIAQLRAERAAARLAVARASAFTPPGAGRGQRTLTHPSSPTGAAAAGYFRRTTDDLSSRLATAYRPQHPDPESGRQSGGPSGPSLPDSATPCPITRCAAQR